MQQMWNTLQLAESKEVFKFKVDKVEVTFLLNDHRTMLKLPQATANNHVEFVEAPELGTMIKFLNILGHAVIIHYAAMIWEGLHYQLMNPLTKNPVIPYPTHPDIPKRSNESHHLVAHDDVVQSIFASGKSKGREAEARENVKLVEQHMLDEDVNKLVEGKESVANQFADDMIMSQEDPDTRIDPGSQKEIREMVKVTEYVAIDEEEEEETAKAELIRKKGKGSLEIRDTPLATPTRSPKTETLSLDKDVLKELMTSKLTASKVSSSKSTPKILRHLQGALARMSKCHGHMLQNTRNTFLQKSNMKTLLKKINEALTNVVPKLVIKATNQNMKDKLPWVVVDAIKLEREKSRAELSSFLGKGFPQ
ncbi:hypothetical protein Tco_1077613 [Tanacetum coccineum]